MYHYEQERKIILDVFIKIVRKATIILKAKTKSVQSIKPGGKMKKKILLCLVSIRNPEIPQIPHNKSAL